MTNDEELLHRRIRKLERENGLLHQRVDRLERERGLVDVKRRQVETTLRRVVADLNRTREAARQAVRMIEQRVVARTVELTRDNDALREARDEAERASAARSHYIASVSHELRTPLNAIIGFSELLREELNDDSGDALISDLSRLHQTAIHLLTLINDLLDFSRLEAGHVTPMIDAFDVGDVVGEVGEMMTPLAEKNRNELSIGGRELAGPLLSDRVKLRQILLNLMANAAKFTQRGEISLTARRRATVIEFAVRDTGIGIDPARFDRLFSPFAQLTTAGASHPGGTGLGLAICHQFCQMLGGELAVESELGAGSTFTLYLPHAPPKPAAFARARGDDGSSRAGGAPRIDAVVLVVDDDDHARADVDRALTDVGAHVLTAGTFDEALALARRERPRVILVDPVVSHHVDDGDAPSSAADAGLAFLAAAAEDPDVDAALVVLSALVSLPRGLVTAAQLVKPALPHELVAIVERVAARTDAS